MPRLCPVFSCNNVGKHIFPKNETLRAQWVKALRLDERRRIGCNLRKTTAICSDHFKESDFNTIPPMFEGDQGSRKLKTNAIPSILAWVNSSGSYVPKNAMVNRDVPKNATIRHDVPEIATVSCKRETPENTISEECDLEFNRLFSKDYTRKKKSIAYIEVIPFPSLESESTDQATDPLLLKSYDELIEEMTQDTCPEVS